jgi:RNA polymerase sigma factor (sigma-70 family)
VGGETALIPDSQLAIESQAGDASAYADLARRWAGPVLSVCRQRLRCSHAAEDSAQETFLRGWRSIESLESPDRFGSWLLGIAHRICLDWLKRKQNRQLAFSVLEAQGASVAIESEMDSVVDRIQQTEEQ